MLAGTSKLTVVDLCEPEVFFSLISGGADSSVITLTVLLCPTLAVKKCYSLSKRKNVYLQNPWLKE